MTPITLRFAIDAPGDPAAGIPSTTDTVDVTVDSGNPGEGFAEAMRDFLAAWYEGRAEMENSC